jgi:iron complex outermembrane receptor protein
MTDRALFSCRLVRALLLPALAACGLQARQEKPGKLQQLSLEELLNVKVTVASRTETTVLEAPSVVTVYTAEDLRRMGARDLRDVLRQVPGFEVGVRAQLGYPEIGVRGILTDNSEKVRILIDGVAVNENLEGSGTILFGDMVLDNVQQIEIIRGPGSALYGTNAFVGVISIITKDAASSGASTTVSARGGSFNTREGSVLSGWAGPRLKVSAYLHYLDTDGPASPVEKDGLQVADVPPYSSSLNSGISLAGGPRGTTHEGRRQLSTQVKLDYRGLYFNGLLVNAHKGPVLGTYFSVNEHSDAHPYQVQGTLGTTLRPGANWVIEPKLYALRYKADNLWNDAPDGFRLQTAGGPVDYAKGSYQINRATQATRGAEVKTTWNSPYGHKVILGGSFEEVRLYQIENFVNVPGEGPEAMVPTPPITQKAPVRRLSSAFAQDQWTFAEGFSLTGGLRMDRYNDAGTSLTPRLALVLHPTPEFHLKAMFGEAFRAPTFVESYLFAGGGFIRGREANTPERIQTAELEGSLRVGRWGLARVTVFQNRIRDLIQLVPNAGVLEYMNTPATTVVKGVEAELKATFTETLSAFINASGQSGHNEATGAPLVGMAHWRGNAGLQIAFAEQWNAQASLNLVGRRERAPGDPRPDLKGYEVLDLALHYSPLPRMELELTAHNALDGDQRYPILALPIPGDTPGEGRSVQLGIRWRF